LILDAENTTTFGVERNLTQSGLKDCGQQQLSGKIFSLAPCAIPLSLFLGERKFGFFARNSIITCKTPAAKSADSRDKSPLANDLDISR
jgi:hypothetical protein